MRSDPQALQSPEGDYERVSNDSEHYRFPGQERLLDMCDVGPWERLRRHGVFPTKVVLHLLLVVLTTWIIIYDSVKWIPYRLANQQNLCHFFYPSKCAKNMCGVTGMAYGLDAPSNCYVYGINQTVDAIQSVVDTYYHIHNKSVANYALLRLDDGTPKPPVLQVSMQRSVGDLSHVTESYYPLSTDDLGPIDPRINGVDSVEKFFGLVLSFQVHFELQDVFATETSHTCYLWDMAMKYDMQNKAELAVGSHAFVKGYCKGFGDWGDNASSDMRQDPLAFWLNVVVIVLCAALILLSCKELWDSYTLLMTAKRLVLEQARDAKDAYDKYRTERATPTPLQGPTLSWEQVPMSAKLRFFSMWQLQVLVASVIALEEAIGSVVHYQGAMTNTLHSTLQGIAAALFWINLCSYLHHSDRLYAVVLVIQQSIPRVGRVLVQVVPIFIGYALFGVMTFGYYLPRFGSLSQAFSILFCMSNGDSLFETIQELTGYFRLVGLVYITTFTIIFIYVILNVVLALVQQTLVRVHAHGHSRRRIHRLLMRGSHIGGVYHRERPSSRASCVTRPLEGVPRDESEWESEDVMVQSDEVMARINDKMFVKLLELAHEEEDDFFSDEDMLEGEQHDSSEEDEHFDGGPTNAADTTHMRQGPMREEVAPRTDAVRSDRQSAPCMSPRGR